MLKKICRLLLFINHIKKKKKFENLYKNYILKHKIWFKDSLWKFFIFDSISHAVYYLKISNQSYSVFNFFVVVHFCFKLIYSLKTYEQLDQIIKWKFNVKVERLKYPFYGNNELNFLYIYTLKIC